MNMQNLASLHTGPDCSMPPTRNQCGYGFVRPHLAATYPFLSTSVSLDCNAATNFNQGCGTSFKNPNSFGAGFNAQGGGWFVMERSKNKGISMWFWSRTDPNVPLAIRERSENMEPDSSWGVPEAYFPTSGCDYDSHFDAHRMIFDTTLCVSNSLRPPRFDL